MRDSLSGVGVLDKAVSVLDALAKEPMALGELSPSTGLPRATAHRIAVALERHRLVGRDADSRFVLGPRLGELHRAALAGRQNLVEAARPALTTLRDRTGESAQLYVRDGDERVCIVSLE
jgi:DNA-binding IclR family transcriptional regulator